MPRRRSLARLPLAAALLLGAAAAYWLTLSGPGRAPSPVGLVSPMLTERLLDDPQRLIVSAAEGPEAGRRGASRISRRWNADQVNEDWSRSEEKGHFTLRSPRLDISSPGEVDSILVSFAELNGLRRFALLWSGESTLDRSTELRNRRELTVLGDPPQRSFWIRGDEIAYQPLVRSAPGRDPLRFLFLRFPRSQAAAPRLQSVALIGKSDLLAARPYGPVRYTLRGETRSAFHFATPGRLTTRTRVAPGAVLTFGLLALDPTAEIRCTVTLGTGADARALLEHRISGADRGWQDFRIALPPAPQGRDGPEQALTLAAESDVPQTLLWSNPTIVVPSRAAAYPNVVLYVIDGLRPDRLGLAGYARQTSPFLDELARRGVVFRNAYAQATWTKPSVTTLLTSLYPQTHGVGARSSLDALPSSVVTLQDQLRAHGYLTAQFAGNAFASTLSNLDQGFDWALGPDAFLIADAAAKKDKLHSDDLNARVLPWIEAHSRERFFVYVHSIDPHPPCAAPRRPRTLPGGDTESELYDEEIRFNDDQIRKLYQKLEQLGIAHDTLFVVTADHGEAFFDHGKAGHGLSVHQEEIRIPLLFVRPGALRPRAVDAPVQAVDVMPTILRHCAVPFDRTRFQGQDLLGVSAEALRSRKVFASRFVYPDAAELPEFFEQEHFAVIEGPSKLIVRGPHGPPSLELYDLLADPGERTDRSAADPGRATGLYAALMAFVRQQQAARVAFLREHPDEATPPARAGIRGSLPQDALERLQSLGYLK